MRVKCHHVRAKAQCTIYWVALSMAQGLFVGRYDVNSFFEKMHFGHWGGIHLLAASCFQPRPPAPPQESCCVDGSLCPREKPGVPVHLSGVAPSDFHPIHVQRQSEDPKAFAPVHGPGVPAWPAPAHTHSDAHSLGILRCCGLSSVAHLTC